MRDEQFGLERAGMVIVDSRPLLECEFDHVPVVRIVVKQGYPTIETIDDFLGNGCLARPRSTGEPNEQGSIRVPWAPLGHCDRD
jgi:hypothetical protein